MGGADEGSAGSWMGVGGGAAAGSKTAMLPTDALSTSK